MSDLFTNWTDDKMLTNGWSSDTVVGRARKNNQFPKDLIPCTSILYTWIDRGIMKTKNVDLLEKFHTNLEVILSKRENVAEYSARPIKDRPDEVPLTNNLDTGK